MPESWEPSGAWLQRLREGLNKHFDEIELDLLISDYFAPLSFAGLSPAGVHKTHEYRIHEVIGRARTQGWLLDLLAAAQERRPKSAELTALAGERGLIITRSRIENHSGTPFEAMFDASMINLAKFYELLPILEGQVCWVHVPGNSGTGFLVGPNLVLTNYHVIEAAKSGHVRWQDITCRFDFKQDIEGNTLDRKKNTVVRLDSSQWLVASLPASRFDWDPAIGNAAEDELDFALLRLAEPVGDLPVGGPTADAKAPKRLWINATDEAPPVFEKSQLVLLQHPSGAPVQMSIGPVCEFNLKGTRLRHRANSKDGSSGSPCFNVDLRLVALHHGHDPAKPPQWNQAIPLGLLQKAWRPEYFKV